MTRSIARPITSTCRPAASPASAAERRRATLEAKVVTTTRPLALATSSRSVLRDIGFRRALAFAHDVGGVADQRQHAFVAERAQPRLVGHAADAGRRVDLPVAGMHDEPRRRANGERRALGDRMRDGDELDVERAQFDAARRWRRCGSGFLARPARRGGAPRRGRRRSGSCRPARRGSATAPRARRCDPRARG